jgi:hypothetical protein
MITSSFRTNEIHALLNTEAFSYCLLVFKILHIIHLNHITSSSWIESSLVQSFVCEIRMGPGNRRPTVVWSVRSQLKLHYFLEEAFIGVALSKLSLITHLWPNLQGWCKGTSDGPKPGKFWNKAGPRTNFSIPPLGRSAEETDIWNLSLDYRVKSQFPIMNPPSHPSRKFIFTLESAKHLDRSCFRLQTNPIQLLDYR